MEQQRTMTDDSADSRATCSSEMEISAEINSTFTHNASAQPLVASTSGLPAPQLPIPHTANVSLKNISIPVPELSSPAVNPAPPAAPWDFAKPSTSSSHLRTISQDFTIDETKSRVAVRFLLKKSKRFYGAIRLYLSKPAAANSSKFKSLVSSLKDTVKSSLANSVTSLSQITNTLMSRLQGQQMPECLRFMGLSLSQVVKRKRRKSKDTRQVYFKQPAEAATFLNPQRKPELNAGSFSFAKPRVYECSYCEARFYKSPLYLKHIRRHATLIRCDSCSKAFSTVVNKRRHQLQCQKRAVL